MEGACTGRPILALGAAVARELYGKGLPIVVLEPRGYKQIRDGREVDLAAGGRVTLGD